MPMGSLAVVGSGEYLPSMLDLESQLLSDGQSNGKQPVFVQLATAAGCEGTERLAYWEKLGAQQAHRLGVEVKFLPVFTRVDAESDEYIDEVSDAALIYFSGGDPNYLASTMRDTALWDAIHSNVSSGGSLAGCSAGAMFLSERVPRLRFTNRPAEVGMGLLPEIQVIPHFDKIHRWIPDAAVRALSDTPDGVLLIGIDEETSLVRRGEEWTVWGTGRVHVLNGSTPHVYSHLDKVTLTA